MRVISTLSEDEILEIVTSAPGSILVKSKCVADEAASREREDILKLLKLIVGEKYPEIYYDLFGET